MERSLTAAGGFKNPQGGEQARRWPRRPRPPNPARPPRDSEGERLRSEPTSGLPLRGDPAPRELGSGPRTGAPMPRRPCHRRSIRVAARRNRSPQPREGGGPEEALDSGTQPGNAAGQRGFGADTSGVAPLTGPSRQGWTRVNQRAKSPNEWPSGKRPENRLGNHESESRRAAAPHRRTAAVRWGSPTTMCAVGASERGVLGAFPFRFLPPGKRRGHGIMAAIATWSVTTVRWATCGVRTNRPTGASPDGTDAF